MLRRIVRELLIRVPLARYGLSLVWRAARQWTVAWIILLLLQGLVPACQVFLTREAVNDLVRALEAPAPLSPVTWLPLALLALLWIVGQALSSLLAWVRSAQAELVQDHVYDLIHSQAQSLDVSFFEHPDSYDLLHRAKVDAVSQPLTLLENLGAVLQNGLTLLALAGMMAAYTPWLPLLLASSALPGLWAVARYALSEHQLRLLNTANERRSRYFSWILTERATAAEIRLFDVGPYHRGRFQEVRAALRNGRLKLAAGALKAELVAGAITWSGGLAGMAWMIRRATRGLAQLGDIVLCYQAFLQGQRLLRSLLDSAGKIYRSTLFLENLHQFLSLQPRTVGPRLSKSLPELGTAAIRFEKVTFRYPGATQPALRELSLELPAGSVTAVVGCNGSGKSTLIKLLCRFYDPQEGRLLIGPTDLREVDLSAFHRQMTVLFQEPIHYHATAADNIAMGDLSAPAGLDRFQRAARAAGAEGPIARLPRGYQTELGKWFGGAELSEGEWQRVALARTFFRRASVLLLDEPTSAMDPWAEAEWLRVFREMTNGRTTLIITHRFTTAMHADLIHVLDEGRIIESGTHAQLVAESGRYAESWQSQVREVLHA